MAKKKVQQPQNDITEFFDALAAYAAEKGIDKDVFAEKIKSAIEKSLKTSMHVEDKDSECVFVNIDFDRKIFNVSVLKEVIEVVDTLYEPEIEIVLEEARKLNPAAQVGDKIRVPIDPHEFKRIAAKNAKDLIKQGFRDIERQQLSEMWGEYENEAVSALVTKIEPKTGHATIEINHNEVLLMRADQIPGEVLHVGDIIKVYITGVSKEYKEGAKKQSLRITRTDRGLIKRLFELECPEIYDGTVEIKAVSRAAGSRSKSSSSRRSSPLRYSAWLLPTPTPRRRSARLSFLIISSPSRSATRVRTRCSPLSSQTARSTSRLRAR